jgi:hypothetical protein
MATNFANGLAIDGYQIPAFATVSPSAEDGDVVTVTIQLYADAQGARALENVASVDFWLSDDSGGDGVAATAPDGGIAATTGGDNQVVAGKSGFLTSDATGAIVITVEESGSDTFYLVLRLPTGRVIVSSALTFAA